MALTTTQPETEKTGNPRSEIVKQIVVWLVIAVLLPLTVWYGARTIFPPPDEVQHNKTMAKIDREFSDAKSDADKKKWEADREAREDEFTEAMRLHHGRVFWIAYPVGLVAIVLGTLFAVQTIGAGLMFGGLVTLTSGCFSYWDQMGDGLRFGCLLAAFLVFLAVGTLRFWPGLSKSLAGQR